MRAHTEAFHKLPFPCLILRPEKGMFLVAEVNPCFLEITGKSREEIIGREYPGEGQLYLAPDWNGRLRKSLQSSADDGRALTLEAVPGSIQQGRYWKIYNIPSLDEAGEVQWILNIGIEQTTESQLKSENNRLQRELDQALEKERFFVDRNPDGLYSLDREGNFTSLNEGLATMAELPEEEMIGMNFLPFCHPGERDLITAQFERALNGENVTFTGNYTSASEKVLTLRISLMPSRKGKEVIGVYGIAKDITRLRSFEEEFHREQYRFQALEQGGGDLTAIIDENGVYQYVGDSSERILGIPPGELVGKNAFDFVHADDLEWVQERFSQIETQNQVRIASFRFRDSDGKWRWLETTATNMLQDTIIGGIVVNSREVTELVERSRELEQLYERYELAATASKDLIYEWDLANREIHRFIKGHENYFGYTSGEIQEQSFWKERIHPQDLPSLLRQLRSALRDTEAHQINTDYRFRRKDGTYADVIDRAHIVRSTTGIPLRLIGATSDVSDLVQNRNALREVNRRFSYAMKATKEMIWDWDLVKDQITRSRSFQEIFGYKTPKAERARTFWMNRIHKDDLAGVEESLSRALEDRNQKNWNSEYRFRKADGDLAYVVDRAFIIRNREGRAIRMVGAALDVTESRRLYLEVKKQNQILREVAWEQAHVVRAPLARLKGLVRVLEEEDHEGLTRAEIFQHLNNSADELDEIIRSIIKRTGDSNGQ